MTNVSQSLLQVKRVYLNHDTIGFIGQAFLFLHPGMVVFFNLFHSVKQGVVGVYLEAQGLEILHGLPVGGRGCLVLSVAQHVDVDIQRALSRDTGVKLAHRAGSGIPGVGKQGQPFLGSLLI